MAAAWLALASAAGATPVAPPSYELVWQRAPGAEACVDARALANAVEMRVGRPVFDGRGATIGRVEGRVSPSDLGWRVTITIVGSDGAVRGKRELELDGADCRAIDEPLALVLALIVDPDARASAPVVERMVPAPPPAPPPAPAVPWRGELALDATGGVGVLPDAGLGARLALVVDAPVAWPIEVGLSWWSADDLAVSADRQVSLRRWQVGAAVCTPAWRLGRARLAGCGGGELTRLVARGVGFDQDHATVATAGLATLGGRLVVDLRRPAFVVAEAGGAVAMLRPRIIDDQGNQVYRMAAGSVVGAVGLGVRF